MKEIVLEHSLCPGDIAVMTVVPREIYRQYGIKVGVCTNHPSIWVGNEFITQHYTKTEVDPLAHKLVPIRYKVQEYYKNGKQHFMHSYLRAAVDKLPEFPKLQLTELRPHLTITEEEKANIPFNGKKFWLLNAGGKRDYTIKWWDPQKWNEVVYKLLTYTEFPEIVQIGKSNDWHPKIKHVHDMRGNAVDLRTMIWLIYHCEGVLCPVTAMMHMAAAFNKPCVVIAGGREAYWWDSYDSRMLKLYGPTIPQEYRHILDTQVPHHYIGNIENCIPGKRGGCWKAGVGEKPKGKNCVNVISKDPYNRMTIAQPKCMFEIHPNSVVEAARSYYEKKD